MKHKLHADTTAHAAWDDLMLKAIGLGMAAERAAARTTAYAPHRSFIDGDQGVLGSPVLDRHAALLTPRQQAVLTEDAPALVTLVTEAGDALADDANNVLVGWI